MITVPTTIIFLCLSESNAWISPRHRPLVPSRTHSSIGGFFPRSRSASSSTAIKSTTSIELDDILSNFDDTKLPLLRIADRIGSGSYGTVHKCFLIKSKDDIETCVAKRAWSYDEIEANVPKRVNDSDKVVARTGLAYAKKETEDVPVSADEVTSRAERCIHYWEVESHCFQKLGDKQKDGDDLLSQAVPVFLGKYHDDGSSIEPVVDGYGLIGKKREDGLFNNGDDTSDGHEWIVFQAVKGVDDETDVLTLLDAMNVSMNNFFDPISLIANLAHLNTYRIDGLEQQRYG
jgi:hypothetical protein